MLRLTKLCPQTGHVHMAPIVAEGPTAVGPSGNGYFVSGRADWLRAPFATALPFVCLRGFE
jgi:hypothetical protein